ncbi:PI-PLC domain-containing protein [Lentzea sp. NPDC059081]|uniref:PI-PLC domain-containing protein n=1 Tax=Lentzea sp. NPDC059081 TaxID=3346719 RepID=UPI003683776F
MRRFPAIAALLLLPLLQVPATANAAPSGTYYVTSVGTGLNVAQNGGGVELHWPKGNEDHQQWRVSDGRFENTDSPGQCITRQLTMGSCSQGDTVHSPVQFGDQWEFFTLGGQSRWYLTPVTGQTESMPADPRLDQMTFLTAHNAYANGVDGGFAPPFVDLAKNQTRGIVQQLSDGVRGFMLDIHQTADGAILCHNSCTLVSKPVALNVDLQRMVDFLKNNRGEIVTVFLEDYVDATTLRAELRKVQGLNDVLYRAEGVQQNGWPTRSQLQNSGKRLIIFTDHGKDGREDSGVLYQRDWTVENYWSMGSGLGSSDWSCYSRWDEKPLTATGSFQPLFVMNHFRDVPISGTATTDNGKLANRAQQFCQPAARKKPNFLAVDLYHLGNAAGAVSALNSYVYRP